MDDIYGNGIALTLFINFISLPSQCSACRNHSNLNSMNPFPPTLPHSPKNRPVCSPMNSALFQTSRNGDDAAGQTLAIGWSSGSRKKGWLWVTQKNCSLIIDRSRKRTSSWKWDVEKLRTNEDCPRSSLVDSRARRPMIHEWYLIVFHLPLTLKIIWNSSKTHLCPRPCKHAWLWL